MDIANRLSGGGGVASGPGSRIVWGSLSGILGSFSTSRAWLWWWSSVRSGHLLAVSWEA